MIGIEIKGASAVPETLRTYASIFEHPRRHEAGGSLYPPSEICIAAARALRLQADLLELAKDARYSSELIGIRVRNELR